MSYTVEALQDALGVLRVVAQHPGLGVSEIGRRAGFTKARTFRFLATFEAAGFVQRGRDGVSYNLGPAALVIGLAAQEQVSLTKLADKHLDTLVAKHNETAVVLVRDGLESVTVAQKNSTHEVRVQSTSGRRRPLHAGASGKVLLAFGPESVENQVLEGELPKVAPQTITSKAKLKKELQRTREQGYATSVSEGAVDVVAVAAPVYASAGLVVASIGLSMPSSRAPEDLTAMARTVCEAARQLSADLGWQPAD
jgi:IclR family transcriptional regulator, KDG regulon repressor